MLALGRAFMARPRLLLLDEPSLGLAPKIADLIMQTIVKLNRGGLTVLLVEQNAHKALSIAHRAYVLEKRGRRIGGGYGYSSGAQKSGANPEDS